MSTSLVLTANAFRGALADIEPKRSAVAYIRDGWEDLIP